MSYRRYKDTKRDPRPRRVGGLGQFFIGVLKGTLNFPGYRTSGPPYTRAYETLQRLQLSSSAGASPSLDIAAQRRTIAVDRRRFA